MAYTLVSTNSTNYLCKYCAGLPKQAYLCNCGQNEIVICENCIENQSVCKNAHKSTIIQSIINKELVQCANESCTYKGEWSEYTELHEPCCEFKKHWCDKCSTYTKYYYNDPNTCLHLLECNSCDDIEYSDLRTILKIQNQYICEQNEKINKLNEKVNQLENIIDKKVEKLESTIHTRTNYLANRLNIGFIGKNDIL